MKDLEQNQKCEVIIEELSSPSRDTSHTSIRPPSSVKESKRDPNMIIETSDVPSGFVVRTTCIDLLMKVTGIEGTNIPLSLERI